MTCKKSSAGHYAPISAYALIGDSHTAALVSCDGSIDWYCPDRFDAPAVFCRVLDSDKGGYMSIEPAGPRSTARRYRESTNILETTFRTSSGKARVTDFMPVFRRKASHRGYDVSTSRRIVRLVEGLAGEVDLRVTFKPTFNYARDKTEIEAVSAGIVAHAGNSFLTLSCPDVSFEEGRDGSVSGSLKVGTGKRYWVVLSYTESQEEAHAQLKNGSHAEELEKTQQYWKKWADRCTYRGRYREDVLRSILTLKMLIYEPTGAIVAAPTTSLPEDIGGMRNWDYRYSWIRDASLIFYALMTVGYQDEATDFIHWLRDTQQRDPTSVPQIMYGIDGRLDLKEVDLQNLDGYMGSKPVRVGNEAYNQFQLDIYGEVLTATYVHYRAPTNRAERMGNYKGKCPAKATWKLLRMLVEQAAEKWQQPDNGIWEVRGGPQQFVYSKVMCWAALDRGIKLAQEYKLEAPVDRWIATRDQIKEAILKKGYDEKIGAFTQAFGSSDLDASALIIPRVGMLPATDHRVKSTIKQIQQQLTHNGLVYRYRSSDGLSGGEGTFTLCSLWMVDALALSGQLEEAHKLFQKVLSYANDVGLLSEEINSKTGDLLGNFPQGFTHLALIRSAVDLAKAAKHGPEEEPEDEAYRATRARRAAREDGSEVRRSKSDTKKQKGKTA